MAEAEVKIKSIEDLESRGPKLPPAGYSEKDLNRVWKYLDPDNSGSTDMKTIMKMERRIEKDMVRQLYPEAVCGHSPHRCRPLTPCLISARAPRTLRIPPQQRQYHQPIVQKVHRAPCIQVTV